jgi:ribosome recycling factor
MALRTGRPSSALVENIKVECYNSHSPLKHLASISIVLPNIIIIEPWDVTIVQAIEKALSSSSLGINPSIEGKQIKLFLPPLTKERKETLIKLLDSIKEDFRIRIRKTREEMVDAVKKNFDEKTITEDDKFRFMEDLQKAVDKINKALEDKAGRKEKEILES